MEQVQNPATTAERKPVVAIQRILPYTSGEVVVEYEHAAAQVRTEGYQYKQQRSPFCGLLLINFDYDWYVDNSEKE